METYDAIDPFPWEAKGSAVARAGFVPRDTRLRALALARDAGARGEEVR